MATLDHINSFFNLTDDLEELNIAPTATGGAGINNMDQFPPPRPSVSFGKKIGTDYVKKYLDKEKNEQFLIRRQTLEMPGSTISVNTLDDVEDNSTSAGNTPAVNELRNEETKQIYATYFKEGARNYDPDLNISSYREEILQQLEINPVLIIQGPTGCGKTTQVPQYILDYHQSRGAYCNIVVTQPRKIAAMSVARRVCQERNWEIGTIVGYQIAMDPKVSSDTCISYVTTGVLLEKLVNAKRMDMYTHIIIDEVHERNQDIDFALLIVKRFLKMNSPRVKVILMSATFDASAFGHYLSLKEKSGNEPVINIIANSHPVHVYYLHELKPLLSKIPEFDLNNPMIDNCLYDVVLNLMYYFDKIEKAEQNVSATQLFAPFRGAVLIFLPGYEEISIMSNKLCKDNINIQRNFWIIPLHSSITNEEQRKVFTKPPPDHRKIIISTNIAESSITVPDVKYVIDFCLTKNLVTDTATNYTCLELEWASKANCTQRKGRAGRVDAGRVYRLVPTKFYEDFPEYGIPEIKRCPLTKTILQLKKLNLCEPQEMLAFALDPPDLSDIRNAVLLLKEALALTSRSSNPFDGELTFIGRVMSNLPLDIKLSKLIIFGYVFHCLEECIIIAASLSLQSFFSRPFQKTLEVYKSRLAWDDSTFSDCLVYLHAYNLWKRLSQQGQFHRPGGLTESDWAFSHFIQIKRIKEVDLLIKEIKSRLEKQQIVIDHSPFEESEKSILILKMVIAGAFFPHYYLQESLDEKTIMRDINQNDPLSTVLVSGLPPKHGILYASALKEMFACCSTNIDIEFEEKKAYIKFGRNADSSSSNVLQPVYLAVKMRKLRHPLELQLFSQEEAERKCEQILFAKNQSRGENRLFSHRVTVKFTPETTIKQIAIPPPGKSGIIEIHITYVKNCSSFWARIISPVTNNLLRFLRMTIEYDQYKNLKVLSKAPVINMLCLAPYVDQGKLDYYRAQIKKFQGKKVEVFFVDYGNTELVDVTSLREIDEKTPDVYTTQALAIECSLANVKPFRSPTGNWSEEANQWLKNSINGQNVQAKIYSVVNDVMRLELHVRDRHGIIHFINKDMIECGMAENAEESFASKQDHELRENASCYNQMDAVAQGDSKGIEVSWTETTSHPSQVHVTGRKIRLHGPYNPLEVTYSGITSVDRSKRVKVERDSVNSISFNPDPQELYSAMLVAASVGVGQSNHDLILRNTTLMPKMRGLPSLLCLLFTPFAEIRTNKDRTDYVGVLCGLGFDRDNGESIYPDHDVEMPFDIEISLKDLGEINKIRMGVNLLLHSQTDVLQYESIQERNVHHQTRKTILKLLQRQWPAKEAEYSRNPFKWNQVPSHLLLETSVERRADHPDVLPLHRPPSLTQTKEQKRMLDHINHLYSLVEDTMSTEFHLIRCELCSKDLLSKRDLLVHLDSQSHQQREQKVRPK